MKTSKISTVANISMVYSIKGMLQRGIRHYKSICMSTRLSDSVSCLTLGNSCEMGMN